MARTIDHSRRKWTAAKLAAMAAALAVELTLGWVLIDGLRAHWRKPAPEPAMTVTEIEMTPSPPPSPPPRAAPSPAGAAVPPTARAPRTEPSSKVTLASPTSAASAGGAAQAGAGSGAMGAGGTGDGGGLAIPARRVAGALSDRDYPRDAGRAGGTVGIAFTVRSDGRVGDCRVLGSSGSPRLDGLTCDLVTARFRYHPAEDAAGHPVESTLRTAFTWGTR